MGAQLQTFPYPTISKPLLSSNGFWVVVLSNCTFQEHDRQTNKHKLSIFGCAGSVQSPNTTELGRVIEDLKHVLASPKKFRGLMHSFTVRGR